MVEREEAQATVKAKETQSIADDAQRDLNEALPALVCPFDSITFQDHSNENSLRWVKCQIILFLSVGDLKALNLGSKKRHSTWEIFTGKALIELFLERK